MIVDIADRIESHFPIGEPPFQLQLVAGAAGGTSTAAEPRAMAVIRSFLWDVDGDLMSVRDVKEQQLDMGWPVLYEDSERVACFFSALAGIIAELVADGTAIVERLMPNDLVRVDALKLERARTREDFDAALRAKTRLGKYLTGPR